MAPRSQIRTTPPSPALNGCHGCATPLSEVACHRPESDVHVVETTRNTARSGLPSGRVSIQSSSDNDATGNGIDRPNCFEIKDAPRKRDDDRNRQFWHTRNFL